MSDANGLSRRSANNRGVSCLPVGSADIVGFLVAAMQLLSSVGAVEDGGSENGGDGVLEDGSSSSSGELFTLSENFTSNASSSADAELIPGSQEHGGAFLPDLMGDESLTAIGKIFAFAAFGALMCTALYVCTYAWKHDRFCFSYPHPDEEHEGMCAVARDSVSCTASDGTEAQPAGASI